jgi:hypothetical protein
MNNEWIGEAASSCDAELVDRGTLQTWVKFSDAAHITVLAEGAGFSSLRNTSRARKEDASESAVGKEKIKDQKTCTLQHHHSTPP